MCVVYNPHTPYGALAHRGRAPMAKVGDWRSTSAALAHWRRNGQP